jgi:hypothetical protein
MRDFDNKLKNAQLSFVNKFGHTLNNQNEEIMLLFRNKASYEVLLDKYLKHSLDYQNSINKIEIELDLNVAFRKGCFNCCYHPILVRDFEWFIISNFLKSAHKRKKLRIKKFAQNNIDKTC